LIFITGVLLNILNLTEGQTTRKAIRRAHKFIAQKIHPDKFGGDYRPMSISNRSRDFLLGEVDP